MRAWPAALPLVLWGCAAASGAGIHDAEPGPDGGQVERQLAEARAVFERNLRAIAERDREAYLAGYRASERLVRAGPDGVSTGFEAFAAQTPEDGDTAWPESLEAEDLELHWLGPGLVYGMYRYRVVFDGEATDGRSERLFVRESGGWVIAVTTAFPIVNPRGE